MKKNNFLFSLLFLSQVFWVVKLNYPPSYEQLIFPLTATWQLWLLRLLTLLVVAMLSLQIGKLVSERGRLWYWFLVLLSPLPALLVMSYPLSALKLAVVVIIIKKIGPSLLSKIAGLALIFALLIVVNIKFLHQAPALIDRLSLPVIQAELTDRFNKEYLLSPGNYVPLQIKRIAYNKYFFLIKDVLEEVLRFADLETIFFQEIHPQNQKGEPIFYWGEFGLFALALYVLAVRKDKGRVGLLLAAAIIYFITSDGQPLLRHPVTFFALSVLIADGIPVLLAKRGSVRIVAVAFILLALYGALAHLVDRLERPQYWLDNKPMVYQIYFDSVPLDRYDVVYVADLFGQGPNYCRFYYKNCSKFIFDNFQMVELEPLDNALYVGFSGNFFGITTRDNFDQRPDINYAGHRIEFIQSAMIRDNVANGYGQRIIHGAKTE